MSWLSKLNPLKWIKDALVSDYVGGLLRHALTAVGVFLVAKGWGSREAVDGAVNGLLVLLTDPAFVGGIVSFFTGWGASVANKKVD